jgi:hypothetical protein
MRLQVEVHPEDEEPLRLWRLERGYSAVRLLASDLLHIKVREEVVRLGLALESESVAEVA